MSFDLFSSQFMSSHIISLIVSIMLDESEGQRQLRLAGNVKPLETMNRKRWIYIFQETKKRRKEEEKGRWCRKECWESPTSSANNPNVTSNPRAPLQTPGRPRLKQFL